MSLCVHVSHLLSIPLVHKHERQIKIVVMRNHLIAVALTFSAVNSVSIANLSHSFVDTTSPTFGEFSLSAFPY